MKKSGPQRKPTPALPKVGCDPPAGRASVAQRTPEPT